MVLEVFILKHPGPPPETFGLVVQTLRIYMGSELGLITGPFLLGGSWDLVTRATNKVTIFIFAYNPN